MDDLLNNLNDVQKKAVLTNHCAELIVAGAGSGKTRVITYKIAYLLFNKLANASEITALTFTNKAAREMKERVRDLLQNRGIYYDPSLLTISTFHSFAANVLRSHAGVLGYSKNFTIYGTSDQKQLLSNIMKQMDIDPKKYIPKNVLSFFASIKSGTIDYIPKGILANLFEEYNKSLKSSDAMDFADLLLLTYELFTKHYDILKEYQARAKFLFVDEYQDTNKLQYKLIKLLSLNSDTICVVGDEDQSIYKWRGADITNILNFEKDFRDTVIIKLEENYRSTGNIIGASSKLISKNIQRKDKVLFTKNQVGEPVYVSSLATDLHEVEYIVSKIKEYKNKGYTYKDITILYRINAQSRLFEDSFRKNNIPYILVGTTGFYERIEIRDLTAYLRFILNPHDNIALHRLIAVPSKGIGKQSLDIITELAIDKGTSTYTAIQQILEDNAGTYTQSLKNKLKKLDNILADLLKLKTESVSVILDAVIDKISYIQYLKEKYKDNSDDRINNVSEFLSATTSYEETNENPSLAGFLESISLTVDEPTEDNEDAVRLMTLHSAKGLEFPIVFIVGVEQNLLPYRRWGEESFDVEEERRLAYVGMTRAKEILFLTYARSRRIFGNYNASIPSIFINEIGDEHTYFYEDNFEYFDDTKLPKKTTEEMDSTVKQKDTKYIGAKVYHNSYGYGIIKKIEDTGTNTKVTIFFQNYGQKKLIWEFAKLKLC